MWEIKPVSVQFMRFKLCVWTVISTLIQLFLRFLLFIKFNAPSLVGIFVPGMLHATKQYTEPLRAISAKLLLE